MMKIPEEDVEHLTLRFNALMESLEVLDQYPLDGELALPALPHPFQLTSSQRPAGSPPSFETESSDPLAYKPITELAHLIRTKQVSPVELTNLYLERIDQFDGQLKSYITVLAEDARREAAAAEQALSAGEKLGPLHGVPLAFKDEFYTKDVLTTCGSIILSEFFPDYDATAVARTRQAGAIMLGKLNMTEWATPLTLATPGTRTMTRAAPAPARAAPPPRHSAPAPWARTPAAPSAARHPTTVVWVCGRLGDGSACTASYPACGPRTRPARWGAPLPIVPC
jgi:hypothetical protein